MEREREREYDSHVVYFFSALAINYMFRIVCSTFISVYMKSLKVSTFLHWIALLSDVCYISNGIHGF